MSFISTTILVEAFGDEEAIRAAKRAILFGLALLVPTMAAAALTGRRLAGASRAPVIVRKLKRMRVIGVTGALVLVPCAITLDRLAQGDTFNLAFGMVQALELLAGATNLTLLALNMRDGFALGAKRRARPRDLRATTTTT